LYRPAIGALWARLQSDEPLGFKVNRKTPRFFPLSLLDHAHCPAMVEQFVSPLENFLR
jgi:hypothetical protein